MLLNYLLKLLVLYLELIKLSWQNPLEVLNQNQTLDGIMMINKFIILYEIYNY